jgi:hypothetical protein
LGWVRRQLANEPHLQHTLTPATHVLPAQRMLEEEQIEEEQFKSRVCCYMIFRPAGGG